jgi:hypothetical protein
MPSCQIEFTIHLLPKTMSYVLSLVLGLENISKPETWKSLEVRPFPHHYQLVND